MGVFRLRLHSCHSWPASVLAPNFWARKFLARNCFGPGNVPPWPGKLAQFFLAQNFFWLENWHPQMFWPTSVLALTLWPENFLGPVICPHLFGADKFFGPEICWPGNFLARKFAPLFFGPKCFWLENWHPQFFWPASVSAPNFWPGYYLARKKMFP